ncbi:MAG: hypothetical protein RL376_1573, partial [Verrucomicrobiota bacterium]
LADLEAFQAFDHEIEQEKVGLFGADEFKRGITIARAQGIKTFTIEVIGEQFTQIGLIFYNQDVDAIWHSGATVLLRCDVWIKNVRLLG